MKERTNDDVIEEDVAIHEWLMVDVSETNEIEDKSESESKFYTNGKLKRNNVNTSRGKLVHWRRCIRTALDSACNYLPRTRALTLLVWCITPFFFLRWLRFYRFIVNPLEKHLEDHKEEAEPIIVTVLLTLPFIISGLLAHSFFLSTTPQRTSTHVSRLVQTIRLWRRQYISPRLDTVDILVVLAFGVVQLHALIGKLLIDAYYGKIIKSGIVSRAGRALGMNGLYAVIICILLVSRKSFVHSVLQLSAERAARYHIWCGNFGALVLVLHGIIYFYLWIRENRFWNTLFPCIECKIGEAYRTRRNFAGFGALLCLLLVLVGSFEWFRRRRFRLFVWTHCFNVGFVLFTCVHYYPAVYWLVSSLLVYTTYRVRSMLVRSTCHVLRTRLLGSILQLDIACTSMHSYQPGQYVYIGIPLISNHEWHPFSITSSPLRTPSTISLAVKVAGPFTTKLSELSRNRTLDTLQIDGYYGSAIEMSPYMVLVAGGSGMSPFLSILDHLCAMSQQSPGQLPRRLVIIWVVRDVVVLKAYDRLFHRIQSIDACTTDVSLYCTGEQDQVNVPDQVNCPMSNVEMKVSRISNRMMDSATKKLGFFASSVAGLVISMILVFSSSFLDTTWWMKRVALLGGAVVGSAVGGWVWMLVGSLKRGREGFEQASIEETKIFELEDTMTGNQTTRGHSIVWARPDLMSLLKSIHEEIKPIYLQADEEGRDLDNIRVLVSGPHSLQEDTSICCSKFHAPFFEVESKSFVI